MQIREIKNGSLCKKENVQCGTSQSRDPPESGIASTRIRRIESSELPFVILSKAKNLWSFLDRSPRK